MNSNGDSVKDSERPPSQQSSLTPAVLGIPSGSHGAKLALNVNSKDRDKLLVRLEEWRQKRREKLMASIMAKGKPQITRKVSNDTRSEVKTVTNTASAPDPKLSQPDGKKSVFERLYENGYKNVSAKQLEETKNGKLIVQKKPQNIKPPKSGMRNKIKVPRVIITNESGRTTVGSNDFTPETTLLPSFVQESVHHGVEDETKSPESEAEPESALTEDEDNGGGCLAPQLPHPRNGNLTRLNIAENEIVGASADIVKSRGNFKVSENVKQVEDIKGDVYDDKQNDKQSEVVKSKCEDMKNQTQCQGKPFNSPPMNNVAPKQRPPLRRSASLTSLTNTGNCESAIHRTQSSSKLKDHSMLKQSEFITGSNRKDAGDKFTAKKRSVCFVTPTHEGLSASYLRNRLENWLTEKGHSIDTYRHLGCFGLAAEGTPVARHFRQLKMDESSNASFYTTAPNTPISEAVDESDKENMTPPPAFVPRVDVKDVEGWLGDLFKLIVHAKYPTDRCEEWLSAISRKYPNCTKLPIYWECMAAINGDPRDAKSESDTEDAKVEEDDAGNKLAAIMDKLVIDKESKTERGLNMKNIFRSKVVKFAITEEKAKKVGSEPGNEACQKVLVATPVRRSARIQTPEKSNIISSLKSLDKKQRTSVSFKPNEALLN